MLERIWMSAIIFIGLLAACRMLLEYWLRSQSHLPFEEVSSLTFLEKVTFVFENFCEKIQRSKDLLKIKLQELFGKQKLL